MTTPTAKNTPARRRKRLTPPPPRREPPLYPSSTPETPGRSRTA
jgi:hypothetical protein